MVGDSISDMQFGRNLWIKTIFISNNQTKINENKNLIDETFHNLLDFAKSIKTY